MSQTVKQDMWSDLRRHQRWGKRLVFRHTLSHRRPEEEEKSLAAVGLPRFAVQLSSDICEGTSSGRLASSSLSCCGAAAGRWNPPGGSGFRASLSEGPEVAGLQRTRALLRMESSVAGETRLGSARPLAPPSEVKQKKEKQTQLASRIPPS